MKIHENLETKAVTTSKLDALTRAGRRGFAIWWLDPEHFRVSTKQLLIVTASIWASLGAGDRVVLLDTVTVLIQPYLQAICWDPPDSLNRHSDEKCFATMVLFKPHLQLLNWLASWLAYWLAYWAYWLVGLLGLLASWAYGLRLTVDGWRLPVDILTYLLFFVSK